MARVTMKGNPVTLLGNEVKVGQPAPDCTLTGNDLSPVALSSFKGKKCIISVVPSLDTPICDLQTKRFNQEAGNLTDTVVLTVSMDLPFAQKRWCGATGSTNVKTLSDYKDAAFGKAYGVLIKDVHLLARSIFVLDTAGKVRYTQLVEEITTEPDYSAVIDAVKKI